MNTIKTVQTVEIKVKRSELIEGRWINCQLLSKKIRDKESENTLMYKALRNKFYNSCSGNKYNMEMKAGMKCINIDDPMKTKNASLCLSFVRED